MIIIKKVMIQILMNLVLTNIISGVKGEIGEICLAGSSSQIMPPKVNT